MECNFKIQYVSDVHLEFRKNFEIIPYAPNLALCGDIGYPEQEYYQTFIKDCSKKFKNVFVIFGNHEYYNLKTAENPLTMDDKREWVQFFPENVYFLDNDVLYINKFTNNIQTTPNKDSIKIIGSTLWSNILPSAGKSMNDTYLIYKTKDKLITDVDIRNFNQESISYILFQLDKDKSIKTVLLTHHGPHVGCFGRNRSLTLLSAYVNHIPKLYKRKNLIACISGHTHESLTNKFNSISFLSNQLGYPKEVTMFKMNRVLEIQ